MLVFPFHAVLGLPPAKISFWPCSGHPAASELLREKSRLLEGGEALALLYLGFASASRFRAAC